MIYYYWSVKLILIKYKSELDILGGISTDSEKKTYI